MDRAYFLQLALDLFDRKFDHPDRLHVALFILSLEQEENVHDQFLLFESMLGTLRVHILIL